MAINILTRIKKSVEDDAKKVNMTVEEYEQAQKEGNDYFDSKENRGEITDGLAEQIEKDRLKNNGKLLAETDAAAKVRGLGKLLDSVTDPTERAEIVKEMEYWTNKSIEQMKKVGERDPYAKLAERAEEDMIPLASPGDMVGDEVFSTKPTKKSDNMGNIIEKSTSQLMAEKYAQGVPTGAYAKSVPIQKGGQPLTEFDNREKMVNDVANYEEAKDEALAAIGPGYGYGGDGTAYKETYDSEMKDPYWAVKAAKNKQVATNQDAENDRKTELERGYVNHDIHHEHINDPGSQKYKYDIQTFNEFYKPFIDAVKQGIMTTKEATQAAHDALDQAIQQYHEAQMDLMPTIEDLFSPEEIREMERDNKKRQRMDAELAARSSS